MRTKHYFWIAIISEAIFVIMTMYTLIACSQAVSVIPYNKVYLIVPFFVGVLGICVFYLKYFLKKTKHKNKRICAGIYEIALIIFIYLNFIMFFDEISYVTVSSFITVANALFFMKYIYPKLQKDISSYENLILNTMGALSSVLSALGLIIVLVDIIYGCIIVILGTCGLIGTYYKYIEFYYKNLR